MQDETTKDVKSRNVMERAAAAGSVCEAAWDSFIAGTDDGQIDVKVTGNTISGTHLNTKQSISGTCTPGRPHRITFRRTDGQGCTHTYDGVIGFVPPTAEFPLQLAVIVGKVTRSGCGMALTDGDDDWVGTHTT